MSEEWRIIDGFPDYAVSNMGRVKRIADSNNNRKSGFILSSNPNPRNGYVAVVLYRGGSRFVKMAHKLVLEAFSGPQPTGAQGNHKNGNKSDNSIENLEWVTASENIRHAFDTGLAKGRIGERSNFSKLKSDEVWLIKKLIAHGVFQWIIAKMFRIDRASVSCIACGKIWKEVVYNGPVRPTTNERGTGSIKKGSRIGWRGKWKNKGSDRKNSPLDRAREGIAI